jgi:hypothetical protein
MAAPNKDGLTRTFSADTIWLLNRDAIAARYHTTPVVVEQWPMYERDVVLKMMQIEADAEKKRARFKKKK